MAWFACAEEGSLLPKEKRRWRAMSVVDFTVVGCGLPSAGGTFCPNAIVRVAANDDGVVPGCPGGGTVVRVVANDDGVVPGCPGGGVVVRVAADHDGVVPGCPDEGTTVIGVVLDIADDRAFEDPMER